MTDLKQINQLMGGLIIDHITFEENDGSFDVYLVDNNYQPKIVVALGNSGNNISDPPKFYVRKWKL